ncbi:MAG TPA: amidohydrolase [Clostridiaceae bacterium]|nr:amidohydrolase [Clostridiaceae bacterium]
MDRDQALYEEVKTIRRDLHEMPELAFDLPKTSAYIKDKLVSYGFVPISVAHTGWVVHIEGQIKEAVAFRADMDGLPVKEATGVSFASKHEGQMHACGHDGHMAMLLGFAKVLSKRKREDLPKSVVLVFQPAEEGPGGAKIIMEDGILEKLMVKSIFGFHLYPGLEEGQVGLCKGPFMARNGEFDLKIKGRSAHAGQPEEGIDALMAGAKILGAIKELRSLWTNPLAPSVVHVGKFIGGSARNIVAGEALLEGTLRAFDVKTYEMLKNELSNIARGITTLSSCEVHLTIRDFYQEVYNDPLLCDHIVDLLEPSEWTTLKPLMLAEDFSFYQEKIPGVFLFLGTRNEEKDYVYPLHHEKFQFEERVLLKGVEVFLRLLMGTHVA